MSTDPFSSEPGRLTIDIWSDIMCPWCYLGDTSLDHALRQFAHRDAVDVRYRSFLLNPELPTDRPVDLVELIAGGKGISPEQFEALNARLADRGRELGLDYRFDRVLAINTTAAHRLTHFARKSGLQREMVQSLFRAYFTDGRNVADYDTLTELAGEIGLDRDATRAALDSGAFDEEVRADIVLARELGITGVPFFVFNGKYAVSGGQPIEVFQQTLETTWTELSAAATT